MEEEKAKKLETDSPFDAKVSADGDGAGLGGWRG